MVFAYGRVPESGPPNHALCQYIRGQSSAVSPTDQSTRSLSAEDLPVRRSATTSN